MQKLKNTVWLEANLLDIIKAFPPSNKNPFDSKSEGFFLANSVTELLQIAIPR